MPALPGARSAHVTPDFAQAIDYVPAMSSFRHHYLVALALITLVACDDDPSASDATDVTQLTDATDATGDANDAVQDSGEVVVPPPIDLALVPPTGVVVAGIAEKPADLVGGPKAEGQLGDFVLANASARFLIEGIRPAGGYRQFGGLLVDADLQPGGEDRLGELWLVWNLRAFRPDTIEVTSDGRDGTAIVRATGRTTRYAWVDAILGDLLVADPIDLALTYEYRLAPDTTTLELVVSFHNDQADVADVRLPAVAMNMGDGAPAYTPGPGLASISGGTSWIWTGGVGLERGYGFIPPAGMVPTALFQQTNVQLSTLPGFQLEAGASTSFSFHFVVSDDGSTTIDKARAALHGLTLAPLHGRVSGETPWASDEGEDVPSNTGGRAWVAVTREADVLALTPILPDGSWSTVVSPGDVQVQAFAPGRGGSEPKLVTAAVGSDPEIDLELPGLGQVVARVRDPDGNAIPAQVSFFRVDAPSPFAPEPVRFDPDWGRERSVVAFQVDSQITAQLLPGEYRVVASRGYSWEIDEATVTVAPGTSQTLEFTLEKTVDDAGWSAADLHLHAFWSPDSEVPYPVRLRQAAANDVSLPVFTEHTYIGPIAPSLAAAGVAEWVTPLHGQEVSTVEYGHFGAYPLVYNATLPSGGAVFEHGWPGTGLFDAIRAQHDGEIIVQVNHPRVSSNIQAYFDSIGLDTTTLVAAKKPERWTLDWDTLEVFNDGCGTGGGNAEALQDWFNLNDLGLKKTLSSGSDSHNEANGVGDVRSWIAVERSAVEADHRAVVAPLRERRTFVSCGPFVRFAARDGTGMGGETAVEDDGEIHFAVRVEAPSWMQVDRVRLLENGVVVDEVVLADWARPDGLRAGVRYDDELVATPLADAWYIVEVVGSGGLWPIQTGDSPYALTNPIDIDQDGDGVWTPPAETHTTRPASARRFPAQDRRALPHSHHH